MIGRRLGVYELRDLVGRGGMGEVYRARDTRLGPEGGEQSGPVSVSVVQNWLSQISRGTTTSSN